MKTVKVLTSAFLVMALLFSCTKEDINELRRKQEELDARVSALEKWKAEIASLQELINALENADLITEVVPIMKDGVEIGYTIKFLKKAPITILNGTAGTIPVISVRKDGQSYYWTINEEWLLDGGNKVAVSAIKPQIRINVNTNIWEVSVDGTTWNTTGISVDEQQWVSGAGNSVVSAVDASNPDNVIFTLIDGASFQISKYKQTGINISYFPWTIDPGEEIVIPYVVPADKQAPVKISASNVPPGWTITADTLLSRITIIAPSGNIDRGNISAEISFLLTDSNNQTWMHPEAFPIKIPYTGIESNTVGAIYYEHGEPIGVVYRTFDVGRGNALEDRRHGLIVHREETEAIFSHNTTLIGMPDAGYSGEQNFNTIMTKTGGDLAAYPALAWCHSFESDNSWFLPASQELYDLADENKRSVINNSLNIIDRGTSLPYIDEPQNIYYWSSTECEGIFYTPDQAFTVQFTNTICTAEATKTDTYRVRAVKSFRLESY